MKEFRYWVIIDEMKPENILGYKKDGIDYLCIKRTKKEIFELMKYFNWLKDDQLKIKKIKITYE